MAHTHLTSCLNDSNSLLTSFLMLSSSLSSSFTTCCQKNLPKAPLCFQSKHVERHPIAHEIKFKPLILVHFTNSFNEYLLLNAGNKTVSKTGVVPALTEFSVLYGRQHYMNRWTKSKLELWALYEREIMFISNDFSWSEGSAKTLLQRFYVYVSYTERFSFPQVLHS